MNNIVLYTTTNSGLRHRKYLDVYGDGERNANVYSSVPTADIAYTHSHPFVD